jgi:hypothetical protein
MSKAFFYQSCFLGDLVPQTFKLTLNKSAKAPHCLLSLFYFLQSKIKYRQSKNCSAGNPPFVNPGLKCTRTDAILKEFELKMNFKLKINLKRDGTNFRSIQCTHMQPCPIL